MYCSPDFKKETIRSWLSCLLLLSKLTDGSPVAVVERPSGNSAENFLEKYGYLEGKNHHNHNAVEVKTALREFQWLSHLPVTGWLDGATQRQMAVPRCGVKDDQGQRAWAQRVTAIFLGAAATRGAHLCRGKRHTPLDEKWPKRHLSYRVLNWPDHLPQGQVALAVHTAFQLWSNVSALVFREVSHGLADIRLAFYEGEHNDGMGNAFDGPGGALAHAFFPCRGEAHFDMAERWTLNGYKGHNLFMVIAHEIGHTLGLEHSPVQHSIMSPYYKKLGKAAVLSWDDILAVQKLYGRPERGQVVQVPGWVFSSSLQDWDLEQGEAREAREPRSPPPYCKGFFDAITMDQNGITLVFHGGLYWTVSSAGEVGSPRSLHSRWAELPLAIEAAAYSLLDKKFYFFKGRRVWRYANSSLDPGFPMRSSKLGLPGHPDCAFYYPRLGHLVLFKGQRYYILNLASLSPEPYYPRSLSDWKGIPKGTNGALSHPDGQVFFFREQEYWSFDPEKVQVTSGGRWDRELSWTGCGRPLAGNDVL